MAIPPSPSLPSSAAPSEGTITRVQEWAASNRRALLITLGLTTVVAGGAGYYYYSTAAAKKEEKKAKKAAKKKGKKGGAGKRSVEGSEAGDAPKEASKSKEATVEDADVEGDPLMLSKADIERRSPSQRAKYALDLKNRGNKAYQAKRFTEAIDLYSKAIECEEQAVFYSNRAACYTNLDNSEAVIRDCTEALRLDKMYIKALNRRAAAREQLGGEENLFEALCDFTTCVILDEFRNESKSQVAERVMKRLATEKAQRILAEREPRLPSPMIIRAYLDAFRPRPKPTIPDSPQQGDKTLSLAFDALAAFDYTHASSFFYESCDQGFSNANLEAHARTMKGTFLFLMGNPQAALEELDRATELEPSLINAWVKKASVHMELGKADQAMADFAKAQEVDPEDGDVYYHRGQVFNVTEQHQAAIEEYRKSAELDPEFIFSHVQLAVAHYKSGSTEKAMRLFKRYIKEHPESAEVHNYFGELLFAEKQNEEAIAHFEEAYRLEELKNGPKNVLPLVNKSLVLSNSPQNADPSIGITNMTTASQLCQQALDEDPTCEVAMQQLAQLKLGMNKIPEAVELFGKGAELAMSEPGLTGFLQFEAAAKAQLAFIVNYPELAAKFGLSPTPSA